jgi:hypothetical protein
MHVHCQTEHCICLHLLSVHRVTYEMLALPIHTACSYTLTLVIIILCIVSNTPINLPTTTMQDDAHVFCLPEQLETEIVAILNLFERVLSRFGFTKYEVMLSTRPAKSVGTDAIWELATDALKGALDIKGWQYEVDEGGGAFYGPKVYYYIYTYMHTIYYVFSYCILLV